MVSPSLEAVTKWLVVLGCKGLTLSPAPEGDFICLGSMEEGWKSPVLAFHPGCRVGKARQRL